MIRMRPLICSAVFLAVSLSAFAQNRGGTGSGQVFQPRVYVGAQTTQYRTYGSPTGFGNVLFPGTGSPPPAGAAFTTFPFSTPTTFVERLGSSISGSGYTGVGPGYGHRRRGGGGGVVAYPVYIGGGGFYGDYADQYANAPQQQLPANITIVMPPQQQGAPMVLQYPPDQAQGPAAEAAPSANSNIQVYQAPTAPRPEPSDDQVLFFIALKDSSVYTAVAYWVEDGTLHYITPQGRHNQVSLDLVDRPTSTKLNEGRKVEFRLPAAR